MDWQTFVFLAIVTNALVGFVDWLVPELREKIWSRVARIWLFVEALDFSNLLQRSAASFSNTVSRVLGERYLSFRSALGALIWSIVLLFILSVLLGGAHFWDVANDRAPPEVREFYDSEFFGRIEVGFWSAVAVFRLELRNFAALIILSSILCDFLSIAILRKALNSVAGATSVWHAWVWFLLSAFPIAGLVGVLFWILDQRPFVINLSFHYWQHASEQFWLWSILPSVIVPSMLFIGFVVAIGIVRVVGIPMHWFLERVLRRSLESEKGVLSVFSVALTGIAAICNAFIRLAAP